MIKLLLHNNFVMKKELFCPLWPNACQLRFFFQVVPEFTEATFANQILVQISSLQVKIFVQISFVQASSRK